MKIALVTDSTCDLPAALIAERNIEVAPIQIIWGADTFADGVDITADVFYQRLASAAVLPKTSQPAPGVFAEKFRRARERSGADAVVCVTLSKKLSGTYQSAIAAQQLVDFPVHVIDAMTTSMALGFVVLAAADARDRGGALDDMLNAVHAAIPRTYAVFTVANLEYLHRSGRVKSIQRWVGSALSIKPILYVKDGGIEPLEVARTRKRSLARIIELIGDCSNRRPVWIGVFHANAPELAEFAAELRSATQPDLMLQSYACSAIGAHTGPGTIGVACLFGMP